MSLKNLRFHFLFLLLAGLSSCLNVGDKENPTPSEPTISLLVNGSSNVSDFSAEVGDTIVISGTATAGGIIDEFVGRVTSGESITELVRFDGDSATTEFVIDPIEYVVGYQSAGKSLVFAFVLRDLEEASEAEVINVTVEESPITAVDDKWTAGYGHASLGNLFNLLGDTLYFPNNVRVTESNQKGVDFIISFDNDLKWSFAASDDENAPATWNSSVNFTWPFTFRNSTRFLPLPESTDFESIQTSAQLEDLFSEDAGVSSVSGLTRDQVLAFRLDADKGGSIGVIKVVDFSGSKANNRQMMISYKLQK